ncbi:MAG: DUF1385 domain-containing protein [Eubacteriales bacterium]
MKRTNIGGQGVLEGVMMQAETSIAIAVRRQSGEIALQKKKSELLSRKNKFLGLPVIRGVASFVQMLFVGVTTITDAAKLYDESAAAEDMKPNAAEEFIAKKTGKNSMDVAIFFAVVVAVLIAVGLFFVLPNFLTGLIINYVNQPTLMNIIDGAIRLVIFLVYLYIITLLPDIKRLFAYHGAEHKVINCFEHDCEMNVENAQKFTTRHPRCGTSYLLLVVVISIFIFTLLGWDPNPFARIGYRILLLPVVAGVSYEFLKLVAKYENGLTRILRAPGMALQALTTKEPDDSMVEVALVSFLSAEGVRSEEEIDAIRQSYSRVKTEAAGMDEQTIQAEN